MELAVSVELPGAEMPAARTSRTRESSSVKNTEQRNRKIPGQLTIKFLVSLTT